MNASSTTRLRIVAVTLLVLVGLQVGAGIAAAAVAPVRDSCPIPMPCCSKGVCPLHARAAAASDHHGPSWRRCSNEVPLTRSAAVVPPAVPARRAILPAPRFAHFLSLLADLAPASALREPQLRPPEPPAPRPFTNTTT